MHVLSGDPLTQMIRRRGFDSQTKARYITCAASCSGKYHRVNSCQSHDKTTLHYEEVTVRCEEVAVLREEGAAQGKKDGLVCEEAALKTVHAP